MTLLPEGSLSLQFDSGFRAMPCGRYLYQGDAAGLLAAAREQLRDWLPRLVLADHFEEHSPYRGHQLRAAGIRVACQGDPDRKRITKAESTWIGAHATILWPHLRYLASAGAGFHCSRVGRWVTFAAKMPTLDPATGKRPTRPHPRDRQFRQYRVVMEFRGGFVEKATFGRWVDYYALGPAVAADEPLARIEVIHWEPEWSLEGTRHRIHGMGLFRDAVANVVMVGGGEVGRGLLERLAPDHVNEVTTNIPEGYRAWSLAPSYNGLVGRFSESVGRFSEPRAYNLVQKFCRHLMDVATDFIRARVGAELQPGREPAEDLDETAIAAKTAAE